MDICLRRCILPECHLLLKTSIAAVIHGCSSNLMTGSVWILPTDASAAAPDIISVAAHEDVITIDSLSHLAFGEHSIKALFATTLSWFHAASGCSAGPLVLVEVADPWLVSGAVVLLIGDSDQWACWESGNGWLTLIELLLVLVMQIRFVLGKIMRVVLLLCQCMDRLLENIILRKIHWTGTSSGGSIGLSTIWCLCHELACTCVSGLHFRSVHAHCLVLMLRYAWAICINWILIGKVTNARALIVI